MIRIGQFSKLSHLTVKALRFYEKEGLLIPQEVDAFTGYRMYETSQLEVAARIKSYRQLGFSIEQIKAAEQSGDVRRILEEREKELLAQRDMIQSTLSVIHHILEEGIMGYSVTVKEIPATTVYYSEVRVRSFSEMMMVIPSLGEECLKLNPGIRCAEPPYEFCEYLDEEHKEGDILIRHNEAVDRVGTESERIRFRKAEAVKVLSCFHKGPYETIGAAYAYLMKYAEDNRYTVTGLARECYIDGIWNKESDADWLTEIQLPIA